jgi:BASS family bile acid:Na+ symporter
MIESGRIAAKIALLTFLVSSLLAAGLTLKLRAILEPWRDRRLVLVALVLNFLAAPALAVCLVRVIPIERPYAIGLLLLGGAAGAPFLPKLVEGAGGDLGFAVALMTLLTVGTTFFMPFVLPLIVPGLQASPWSIARPLIALILAPLAIGMVWRSWAPASSAVFQPILARLGSLSAVVLIVLLGLLYFDDLLDLLGSGVLAAAAFYIGSLTVAGYLLGGPHDRIRGVLGLGTGARNIGAALVAASESFSEPKVMIMLVASTIVMLIVLLPAARWLQAKARS